MLTAGRREARDNRAVAFEIVDVGDALSAAIGAAILVRRGALAIAVGAHRQDELLAFAEQRETLVGHRARGERRQAGIAFAPRGVAEIFLALFGRCTAAVENRQRNHRVAFTQRHPAHAGRAARLEFTDGIAAETDGLALARRQQHVVVGRQQRNADQAVVGIVAFEFHRNLARSGHVGERVHRIAAHRSLGGREHDMKVAPGRLVLGQRQHGRDRLACGQREQIDHRASARRGATFGQLPDLQTIDLARRREEQHWRVCRRHEQIGDRVLVLGRHAAAALAATVLRAERLERGALDIAAHRDGDDHVFARDQIFIVYPIGSARNFAAARRRELGAHRHQFVAHDGIKLHTVCEDFEQAGDAVGERRELGPDFLAAERGEARQPQVEDCLHLQFGQFVDARARLRLDRLDQLDVRQNLTDRPFARE